MEIKKLGNIYLSALTEVVSTTTGIHLHVKSQESDSSFGEIIGVMSLDGQKNGMLFVSAKISDVRILCSGMIGVPLAEVSNDDLDDTICELVNMTAGSAKVRLSDTDYMFSLSQPFAIRGRDLSLAAKNQTEVVSGTLGNEEISVKLKALY